MSKHRGEPVVKHRIRVMESERGWGGDEWYEYFDTPEQAQERITEINSANTSTHAPDYYVQAFPQIKEVTL